MTKSFAAKFNGQCRRCKQPITMGQTIESRTHVDPWVHSGCQFLINPDDAKNVAKWEAGLNNRGFVRDGMMWDWTSHDDDDAGALAWWIPHGEGYPEYHMVVVPAVLFKTLHPDSALAIFDALTADRKNKDDVTFNQYREQLLERFK